MISTVTELRKAFWQGNEHLKSFYRSKKRQNDYSATIRCEWCDFVEHLRRSGDITENLAERATL